jgi:transposase
MLIPAPNLRVYIATGNTDMRKAINGLSILVESRMELDPFSGQIFVFSNRRRNRWCRVYAGCCPNNPKRFELIDIIKPIIIIEKEKDCL